MNKQSRRFHELLTTIAELHDKKQHDYGADEDIFANFRLSELSGVPAWQGSVIRMGDKYSRISNFIKKGEFKFKEESIKDTLCLLYTSPSPRDRQKSRMPSSA